MKKLEFATLSLIMSFLMWVFIGLLNFPKFVIFTFSLILVINFIFTIIVCLAGIEDEEGDGVIHHHG